METNHSCAPVGGGGRVWGDGVCGCGGGEGGEGGVGHMSDRREDGEPGSRLFILGGISGMFLTSPDGESVKDWVVG